MKKSYVKLSLRHCEVNMKYDDLVKVATNTCNPNTDTDLQDEASSGDIFTNNELKNLKCTALDKKNDSTFILKAIRYLYKDVSVLQNKTLQGTLERKIFNDDGTFTVIPPKDALTPEKVKRVEQLFIDRVTRSNCGAVEYGERLKLVNKLFASAVSNLTKPFKTRDKADKAAIEDIVKID